MESVDANLILEINMLREQVEIAQAMQEDALADRDHAREELRMAAFKIANLRTERDEWRKMALRMEPLIPPPPEMDDVSGYWFTDLAALKARYPS